MGRFALLFSLLAAGGGGYIGYVDLEVMGAIVGAVLGLIVGALVGDLIDLSIGPFIRKRAEHSVGAWTLRIIGLVIILVLLHEAFWASNIGALAMMHNIGARVTHLVSKKESQKKVQNELNDRRWQPQVCSARPQRYILQADVAGHSDATLEMIDDVVKSKV